MQRSSFVCTFLYIAYAFFLSGCAASGPGYDEATRAAARADSHVRVVFLRPKDRDDGANGGRAVVRIGGEKVGALAYGGFFFVDLPPAGLVLRISGRYPVFGSCEVQLDTVAGATVYFDVGPRISYMIAGTVGAAAGGVIAASTVPQSVASVGQALVHGTTAVAAGSAVGSATGVALEGQQRTKCAGPYKLASLDEEDALRRLKGLALSK